MYLFPLFVFTVVQAGTEPISRIELPRSIETMGKTRRILRGNEVGDTRPYMVYLRPAQSSNKTGSNWLCGGVIVHEHYILTSAACIENVEQFYVISGTHRWTPMSEAPNDCIKYGNKKAVWKCVPKSYFYDGNDFDNIRWMVNDIAIVKTEDDFNFERRVRGCDFIPKKIAFNNFSSDLEKPGTLASTAGWGSVDRFADTLSIARTTENSPTLLETDVVIISKKKCKARWDPRYHYIIDDYMICGKDSVELEAMSAACLEHDINCKELVYSDDEDEDTVSKKRVRRTMVEQPDVEIHTGHHFNESRRLQQKATSSGFCENDHGGPLVVGQGKSAVVVGVISACQTRDLTNKCYGPFLYTSVWNNRHLVNCAVNKDIDATCRLLLRSLKTHETIYNWSGFADRPEMRADRKDIYEDSNT